MVIPTLNAESEIGLLIETLLRQTVQLSELIVVDSDSNDSTVAIASLHKSVSVRKISRSEFNHGLTRDAFLRQSLGDIVCFMTQDAVPANELYLEHLIAPLLKDKRVAMVSGRQLPKRDARRFEQLIRAANYPAESDIRSSEDIGRLGIRAFFATDVCSAYRREAYVSCGGFERVDTNEDMLLAAKALRQGWKVAYAADAEVYHSHNLPPKEQYRRNVAIGSFLERYSDLLDCPSEVGEGSRVARRVAGCLIREMNMKELLLFVVDVCARALGNRVGRWKERRELTRTGRMEVSR